MNFSRTKVFQRILVMDLMFSISFLGCQSNSTDIMVQPLSTTHTLVPTTTSSIIQVTDHVITRTQLPATSPTISESYKTRSLILFVNYLSGGFIDADTGETITLPNSMSPIGWSPSSDRLLLRNTVDGAFYIANAFGQNMELLFKPESGIAGRETRWLTNDSIIAVVEIKMENTYLYTSQFFILDAETGEAKHLEESDGSMLIATEPNGRFWLESRGISYIVYPDGRSKVFPGEIRLSTNGYEEWIEPKLGFLPNGQGFIYIHCDQGECKIYISEITNRELTLGKPIFNLGNAIYADTVHISRNSEFVAWYNPWASELVVFDIEGRYLNDRHAWPLGICEVSFIWSPDSSKLAVSECAPDGDLNIVTLIDRSTDEMTILTTVLAEGLSDWRNVPIE